MQPVTRPWQCGHIASLGGLYTRPVGCGIVSARRPPLGGAIEGQHGIQGRVDESHSIVLGFGAQVFLARLGKRQDMLDVTPSLSTVAACMG